MKKTLYLFMVLGFGSQVYVLDAHSETVTKKLSCVSSITLDSYQTIQNKDDPEEVKVYATYTMPRGFAPSGSNRIAYATVPYTDKSTFPKTFAFDPKESSNNPASLVLLCDYSTYVIHGALYAFAYNLVLVSSRPGYGYFTGFTKAQCSLTDNGTSITCSRG